MCVLFCLCFPFLNLLWLALLWFRLQLAPVARTRWPNMSKAIHTYIGGYSTEPGYIYIYIYSQIAIWLTELQIAGVGSAWVI